jgi:NUDIX domain.
MRDMRERTIGSRRAFAGRLLNLRVDEVELESGRRASREIVEHRGAVAICAWDGERLAMVRQWRQATEGELLEIPAGTLDANEQPRVAAERELAEECGLAARLWEEGPTFFTAPGFSTERLTLFLATELTPVSVEPPDDEALERSWVALPELLAAADAGRILDAKSLVGIYWLARRLAGPES